MSTARLFLLAAALLFCRTSGLAHEVKDRHVLDGMLEEPPGVKVISLHGYAPSTDKKDGEGWFTLDDAAVTEGHSQEPSSLVLEVTGPRQIRLHFRHDWPDTSGYCWLRLDGRIVRQFREPGVEALDITIPPGAHHIEFVSLATHLAVFKVADAVTGLPALKKPVLLLPYAGAVSLALAAESDSPVTWSAEGLPAGLSLDAATGRLTGTATGLTTGSENPLVAWITMTNAHGQQREPLWIQGTFGLEAPGPGLLLAGRNALQDDFEPFLSVVSKGWSANPPFEALVTRGTLPAGKGSPPELFTTVTGPDTLWFRARGSVTMDTKPGALVVRRDGTEVIRRYIRSSADDEFSVSVPAGVHEVSWEFAPGARIDHIRLESAPGPRLRGPFALAALPGTSFSLTLTATHGPVTFSAEQPLPPGVNLNPQTGAVSGTLATGDYWLVITAKDAAGKSDTAIYGLAVHEDAAVVLGKPGLTWRQTPGLPWRSRTIGPDEIRVWEYSAPASNSALSRMETFVDGPDVVACRFSPLGSGWMELELDGQRQQVAVPFPGWENYITVRIPPGRHLLALHMEKTLGAGGIQVEPLAFGSFGAPVITAPRQIFTDGTPLRVPLAITGGTASATAGDLPPGLTLNGNIITGSLEALDQWLSLVTATRAGQTVSSEIWWQRNEINEWIENKGWYGYSERSPSPTPDFSQRDGSWDGIDAMVLAQAAYGLREMGLARLLTGPDTLTFRRRVRDGAGLEVKVDGAVTHSEPVIADNSWQMVSVPIPAGEHHVTIAARSRYPDRTPPSDGYPAGDLGLLFLDDFRLASESRPAIVEATRRLEVLPGQSISFRPQTSGNIQSWSLQDEVPPGFTFNVLTGTLSAAAVTAPPGEYYLVFTAANASGSAAIGVTLAVLSPPAHGDSPKLFLMKEDWDFEPEGFEPPVSVDGGEIHYAIYNNLGIMSAWIEGPDTLQFYWRFMGGDTFFYVRLDGEDVYRPMAALQNGWQRVALAIPPGRHLVSWYGYDTVAVDHITLRSDGIPQLAVSSLYSVNASGFSLQLTAANNPVSWTAEGFTVSQNGILSGVLDPPEERTIRVSATNAAGTGYALITLLPQTTVSSGLDTNLECTSSSGNWIELHPPPGVNPVPADGEDYVHNQGTEDPLAVTFPSGGGLLSVWVHPQDSTTQLQTRPDDFHEGFPAMRFGFPPGNLPGSAWHRVFIPLPEENGRFFFTGVSGSPWGPLGIWLDRAEIFHPGDALIDIAPLPPLTSDAPYAAQLKLATGGPVTWHVIGLPPGLACNSTTGAITGTLLPGAAASSHPLQVTARETDTGRTTFAWMSLRTEFSLAAALDTQDLVWRRSVSHTSSSRGWEAVAGAGSEGQARDGVDMLAVFNLGLGSATVETEVDGPGTISFWWAGTYFTRPSFLVDGVTVAKMDFRAAGVGLRYVVRTIPPGHHTLTWVADAASSEGSAGQRGMEALLDRVQWSKDGAPRFESRSFHHEVAPGRAINWPVTATGGPVTFISGLLPPGLTFDSAAGILRGRAPLTEARHEFFLTTEHADRQDVARFVLNVRSLLEEVNGGQWHRQPDSSRWLAAADGTGGSLLSFSRDAAVNVRGEELRLAVTAPCVVAFRSRLGAPASTSAFYVYSDDQPIATHYARTEPGNWLRAAVTVPGNGPSSVYFTGYTDPGSGALEVDDVRIFPWDADANGDGLSNGMACALARWPDAIPAGDPPFIAMPHPDSEGSFLLGFGDAGGDPVIQKLRDGGLLLLPQQSTGLGTWSPATAAAEPPGDFARVWRIPAPAMPRTFFRVRPVLFTDYGTVP